MTSVAQPLSKFQTALLSFVRKTPLRRGTARRWFIRYFRAHISHPIMTDFRGVPIILNLDNTTEQKALFGFYDLEELAFMRAGLKGNAPVFVDIGANSGFYTQNFLALGKGTVLAIEPNPDMRARIKENHAYITLQQGKIGTMILEDYAIGAEAGQLFLDLSTGAGGAHIVPQANENTLEVKIERLDTLLNKHNLETIDVLKIDVEGYEDRALVPFLSTAPDSRLPKRIIMEYTSDKNWESDLYTLLKDKGYRLVKKTRGNYLLQRA